MKTATILPVSHLHLTKNDDYHMCLAHLIEANEEYTNFYKFIGSSPDKYLIMDNGVIEGEPQDIHTLVRRARMVGAQEIILPDIFRNKEATLDASYEALQIVRADFPEFKVMVVPQGDTYDEVCDCLEEMLSWDIDSIGIPKMLTQIKGTHGRRELLEYFGHRLRGLNIHLLGCHQTPLEIMYIERAVQDGLILPVRGVDSVIAYEHAFAEKDMDECERPKNGPVDFVNGKVDEVRLQRNINMWKSAAALDEESYALVWSKVESRMN